MTTDENFYKNRQAFYDADSWIAYRNACEATSSSKDYGAYLPDPIEVQKRIAEMDWLQSYGFNNRFICSVMQFDSPSIKLVKRFVYKYGVDETLRRLKPMLENNEYDNKD